MQNYLVFNEGLYWYARSSIYITLIILWMVKVTLKFNGIKK